MNPVSVEIRDEAAIERFEQLDSSLADVAAEMGAAPMQYPCLIHRNVLEKAEYPAAFPHLLLSAMPMELNGESNSRFCLSPAVCYHAYAQLAEQRLAEPRIITARGRCFRNEADFEPGRRQIEFEMREIIFIGPADWVQRSSQDCRRRVTEVARRWSLDGQWNVAADPFFLPQAAGKAVMQRMLETKLEYQGPPHRPMALASVNRHADFFGKRFDITDRAGRPVHTACVAAGLDRWMSAATVLKEAV